MTRRHLLGLFVCFWTWSPFYVRWDEVALFLFELGALTVLALLHMAATALS